MRASPVGWAFGSLDEVIDDAERSARVRALKHRLFPKFYMPPDGRVRAPDVIA